MPKCWVSGEKSAQEGHEGAAQKLGSVERGRSDRYRSQPGGFGVCLDKSKNQVAAETPQTRDDPRSQYRQKARESTTEGGNRSRSPSA